jgi:carbamate kinase
MARGHDAGCDGTDATHAAGDAGQAAMTRMVLALGGNALAPSGDAGTAEEQTANVARAMAGVADLVVDGADVILTHGNGPQVGSVLLAHEIARDTVPMVPLDWCVAETQATIGFTAASALDHELAKRGVHRPVAALVSRVRVDMGDPAWDNPTKPIGSWLTEDVARVRSEQDGHAYRQFGDRGWRRVVASPEPLASVDLRAIEALVDAGAVVIANGGGGIPEVRVDDGPMRGVEAVIDKDLASAMLARELAADRLTILTDVPGVAVDFGTPDQRWLGEVSVSELRQLQGEGHFGSGSMGPKVEAVLRFVEGTGNRASIGQLDDVVAVARGTAGTQVSPD